MWWCCGKPKINSPGCKFQKHRQKVDEIDDDEVAKLDHHTNMRCESCKELGHRAAECDKDPNIRTSFNVGDESLRISKLKTHKKKLSDSQEVTFKVMEKATILNDERRVHSLMTQDDFSYGPFNKRIFELDIAMVDLDYSDGGSQKGSEPSDDEEKRNYNLV